MIVDSFLPRVSVLVAVARHPASLFHCIRPSHRTMSAAPVSQPALRMLFMRPRWGAGTFTSAASTTRTTRHVIGARTRASPTVRHAHPLCTACAQVNAALQDRNTWGLRTAGYFPHLDATGQTFRKVVHGINAASVVIIFITGANPL